MKRGLNATMLVLFLVGAISVATRIGWEASKELGLALLLVFVCTLIVVSIAWLLGKMGGWLILAALGMMLFSYVLGSLMSLGTVPFLLVTIILIMMRNQKGTQQVPTKGMQ